MILSVSDMIKGALRRKENYDNRVTFGVISLYCSTFSVTI